MHRRISHTLNTLRQGLAAKLGGDFIDHACRLAGHSWCDSCLLTPAAIIHWFLVQILHGNTAPWQWAPGISRSGLVKAPIRGCCPSQFRNPRRCISAAPGRVHPRTRSDSPAMRATILLAPGRGCRADQAVLASIARENYNEV